MAYRLICTGRADDICREYPATRRFGWPDAPVEALGHEQAHAGHHVTLLDGEDQMDRRRWLNAARPVVTPPADLAGVA